MFLHKYTNTQQRYKYKNTQTQTIITNTKNTQTQSIDTNTVAESVSVSSSSWLAAATGHSDKFRLLLPPATILTGGRLEQDSVVAKILSLVRFLFLNTYLKKLFPDVLNIFSPLMGGCQNRNLFFRSESEFPPPFTDSCRKKVFDTLPNSLTVAVSRKPMQIHHFNYS